MMNKIVSVGSDIQSEIQRLFPGSIIQFDMDKISFDLQEEGIRFDLPKITNISDAHRLYSLLASLREKIDRECFDFPEFNGAIEALDSAMRPAASAVRLPREEEPACDLDIKFLTEFMGTNFSPAPLKKRMSAGLAAFSGESPGQRLRRAARDNNFQLVQQVLSESRNSLTAFVGHLTEAGKHGWNTLHFAALYKNEALLSNLIRLVNNKPALESQSNESAVTKSDEPEPHLKSTKKWGLLEIIRHKGLSDAEAILSSKLRITAVAAIPNAVAMTNQDRCKKLLIREFYKAYNMCGTLVSQERGAIAAEIGVEVRVKEDNGLVSIIKAVAPFLFDSTICNQFNTGVTFSVEYLHRLQKKFVLKMAENIVNYVGGYGEVDDFMLFHKSVFEKFADRFIFDFSDQINRMDEDGIGELVREIVMRIVHYVGTDGLLYESEIGLFWQKKVIESAKEKFSGFINWLSLGYLGREDVRPEIPDKVTDLSVAIVCSASDRQRTVYLSPIAANTPKTTGLVEELLTSIPMDVDIDGQRSRYTPLTSSNGEQGRIKYGIRKGTLALAYRLSGVVDRYGRRLGILESAGREKRYGAP